MNKFIADNGLIKRLGFDEWYSQDDTTRLVKIGERYRLDVKYRKNWTAFRSDYIVGNKDREFKAGRSRI